MQIYAGLPSVFFMSLTLSSALKAAVTIIPTASERVLYRCKIRPINNMKNEERETFFTTIYKYRLLYT